MTNYEIAIKAEAKRVTRCLHLYSSETRAMHAASFRLSQNKRRSIGEYFYVHPEFPHTAFKTRGAAARAAVENTAGLGSAVRSNHEMKEADHG